MRFAKTFKQITSFQFKRETGKRLWQRSYYDHILRSEEGLDAVAWYIWLNPVRAHMCANAEDYPYSGSMTIEWKKKAPSIENWTPPWKRPT